jgi:hypothetical protein
MSLFMQTLGNIYQVGFLLHKYKARYGPLGVKVPLAIMALIFCHYLIEGYYSLAALYALSSFHTRIEG